MRLEVSLTVVAAILTVIGYSLNDTIIIFDRVRENLKKARPEPLYDVLNRSINETLPRSVLTHATSLAATLSLLLFAGEVIRPFAWIMRSVSSPARSAPSTSPARCCSGSSASGRASAATRRVGRQAASAAPARCASAPAGRRAHAR